jgi:hypothetical protein
MTEYPSAPVRQFASSRRGASRPTPSLLADRERSRGAVLYWPRAGDGCRSGALFGARVGALDRRLGCSRRCRQHRLTNAVPCTAQPRQATSLRAPVTAPGTARVGQRYKRVTLRQSAHFDRLKLTRGEVAYEQRLAVWAQGHITRKVTRSEVSGENQISL